MGVMHALFAGLTTLDVIHALDHAPSLTTKTTSTQHLMAAGGPSTNAAVTVAALGAIVSAIDEDGACAVTLLSAVGGGAIASVIRADLDECAVGLLDATRPGDSAARAAVSSIIEHPDGRMVASTNARIDVDAETAERMLDAALAAHGAPDVVLVDGHNPKLADLALRLGVAPSPGVDDDPFADIDVKPSHLRLLDGGSWKDWFTPLLPLIDVAVLSADFCPPLMSTPDGDAIARFLAGFGITRVIRTQGPGPIQWWWDAECGETPASDDIATSTLGAGDVFHGALAWAFGLAHAAGEPIGEPTKQIRFAARIAGISTTLFGTRTWIEDERTAQAVRDYLNGAD